MIIHLCEYPFPSRKKLRSQTDNVASKLERIKRHLEPFYMLLKALNGVLPRLTRRDQQKPIAGFQHKQLAAA
jgi:hypothetical protein